MMIDTMLINEMKYKSATQRKFIAALKLVP